jgi:hypothetical protein
MENVQHINIPPKTVEEKYRNHVVVVTFDPIDGRWAWYVDHTTTLRISGAASTLPKAITDGKKTVDKWEDGVK